MSQSSHFAGVVQGGVCCRTIDVYVYVPGTVLDAGDTAGDKPDQVPRLWSSTDATETAILLPLCHSSPYVLNVREQGSWQSVSVAPCSFPNPWVP